MVVESTFDMMVGLSTSLKNSMKATSSFFIENDIENPTCLQKF